MSPDFVYTTHLPSGETLGKFSPPGAKVSWECDAWMAGGGRLLRLRNDQNAAMATATIATAPMVHVQFRADGRAATSGAPISPDSSDCSSSSRSLRRSFADW